jgi:hypothetical protein
MANDDIRDEEQDETPDPAPAAAAEEKKSEIDWSKVDPADVPHGFVERTTAFQGIRSDLQETREALRTVQTNQAALADQVRDKQDDNDPLAKKGDEELLTVGEARTLLQQREAKAATDHKKADAERQKADRDERIAVSEARLRQTYSPQKAPKGLDADTVIHEGALWLKQNRPAALNACLQSPDPAQEIYDLATALVPTLRSRVQENDRTKLLKEINRGRIPGTAGAAGASDDEVSELVKMLNTPSSDLGKMFADAIEFEGQPQAGS